MQPTERHLADLCAALSATLGEAKANELVVAASRALGPLPNVSPRERALMVLDHIAAEPGLVSAAARFARSRLHLTWAREAQEHGRKG